MTTCSAQPYCGVILAAGAGRRIQPLSAEWPKPLLPICNKPIIQHQIEHMMQLGITRFLVVTHHLKDKLIHHLRHKCGLELDLEFVVQEQPLGIAHAVATVERFVDGPFLLFLGDVFVVPRQLERLLEIHALRKAAAVLATKTEDRPQEIQKNFAVVASDDGRVIRAIEKPRHPSTNLKGCGVYLFDVEIFDAVRRTPRTAMRDEYEITSSVQILIDDGCPVYAAEVVEWDMNVTTPGDLLACNLEQLRRLGKTTIVGEGVELHPRATLRDCVIGDNCWIQHPIAIDRSVVFPGSVVTIRESLRDAIVSGAMIYQGDHAAAQR